MPNWCSTEITIKHESIEKLEELKKKIEEFMSHDFMKNDFGHGWLGNIVGNSGIGKIDDEIRCRGTLDDMEIIDGKLVIDETSAWVPVLKLWSMLLEKYLPDAQMSYSAIECGCELFATDDETLAGCYYVDVFGDVPDVEACYDMGEKALIETLQKLLRTEETDVGKLIKNAERKYELSIHKWEYLDADEFE